MTFDALETLHRDAVLDASVDGAWTHVGARRGGRAIIWVGGDVTGAGATLACTIQASATGSGASAATLATFANVTDEMVGYVATTTPRYEVPGEDPISVAFETGAYPYIRAHVTLSGTSPVFNGVSIEVQMNDLAYARSGT